VVGAHYATHISQHKIMRGLNYHAFREFSFVLHVTKW
jgi:hypothetical protein